MNGDGIHEVMKFLMGKRMIFMKISSDLHENHAVNPVLMKFLMGQDGGVLEEA